MAQAEDLVHASPLVERERRRFGVGQDLEARHRQLYFAGGDVRIDVLWLAPGDCPEGADHVLGAQGVCPLVRFGRVLGVEHELDDARAVAQVDEDQSAVIPPAVHPTGYAGVGVRAVRCQVPAPGVPVGVGARCVLHPSPRRMAGITS